MHTSQADLQREGHRQLDLECVHTSVHRPVEQQQQQTAPSSTDRRFTCSWQNQCQAQTDRQTGMMLSPSQHHQQQSTLLQAGTFRITWKVELRLVKGFPCMICVPEAAARSLLASLPSSCSVHQRSCMRPCK